MKLRYIALSLLLASGIAAAQQPHDFEVRCHGDLSKPPSCVSQAYYTASPGVEYVLLSRPGDPAPKVLILGNSGAAMLFNGWSAVFPDVPAVALSYYSNTCGNILASLPQTLAAWQRVWGGQLRLVINLAGQCDGEHRPPTAVGDLMSCVMATSQVEQQVLGLGIDKQLWMNVATDPFYSTGPPSNYPRTMPGLFRQYNAAYAATGLTVFDQASLVACGDWTCGPYATYNAVDLNPFGIDKVLRAMQAAVCGQLGGR